MRENPSNDAGFVIFIVIAVIVMLLLAISHGYTDPTQTFNY